MDKNDLVKMYMDFFNKANYNPELKGNNIYFNYKKLRFFIELPDAKLGLGRIGHISNIHDKYYDIFRVINQITTKINRIHHFTKMYVYRYELFKRFEIIIDIPYFVDDFSNFKRYFDEMVDEIVNTFKTFDKYFQDYLNRSNKNAVPEKTITINGLKGKIVYSLSNDIDEIIDAIYKKTGVYVDNISECEWELNPELEQEVRDLMEKQKVVYSMAVLLNNDMPTIVINHKINDEYYFYEGYIFDGQCISRYKAKQLIMK